MIFIAEAPIEIVADIIWEPYPDLANLENLFFEKTIGLGILIIWLE